MEDKTKQIIDIELLKEPFKTKAKWFIAETWRYWVFVVETLRTQERQDMLVKQWFSYVKHSNHQDGLAIDIWFIWKELYPSDTKIWRTVANIAKKYWIDWWYDLWKFDKPHFQNNNLPITINPMQELEKKQIEAITSLNSVLWQLTLNAELKKKLEEMNNYLRAQKQ